MATERMALVLIGGLFVMPHLKAFVPPSVSFSQLGSRYRRSQSRPSTLAPPLLAKRPSETWPQAADEASFQTLMMQPTSTSISASTPPTVSSNPSLFLFDDFSSINSYRELEIALAANYTPPNSSKEQKWSDYFLEVTAFTKSANVTKFPKSSRLGKWVHQQRVAKQEGTLSQDRIDLLDSIGFDWEFPAPRQQRPPWDTMYAELVNYQKQHGHCRVPKSQGYLGVWVKQQRYYYKQRIKLQQQRQQEQEQEQEQGSKEQTSSLPKSLDHTKHQSLIERMDDANERRKSKKKNKKKKKEASPSRAPYNPLTQERIDLLNGVNFTWTVQKTPPRTWRDSYRELVEFYVEYGHTHVTYQYGDRRLMDWIRQQRQHFLAYQQNPNDRSNALDFEKISLLQKIGFRWEDPKYLSWKEAYRQLSHYYTSHGHTNVLPEEGWYLHLWVQQQRLLFTEWMNGQAKGGARRGRQRQQKEQQEGNVIQYYFIDEEKVQLLLCLNFLFDPLEADFWEQYEKLRSIQSPDPRRWSIRVRQWVQQQKQYYYNDGDEDDQKWWIFNNQLHLTDSITEDDIRSFRWPQAQFDKDKRILKLQEQLQCEYWALSNRTAELHKIEERLDDRSELGSQSYSPFTSNTTIINDQLKSRFWKRLYRDYRRHSESLDAVLENGINRRLTPDRLLRVRKIVHLSQKVDNLREELQDWWQQHVQQQEQQEQLQQQRTNQRRFVPISETPASSGLSWDDLIQPLYDFHKQNGHCRIPLNHATLGELCDKLRQRYSRHVSGGATATETAPTTLRLAVSPRIKHRVEELNAMGFVWDRRDQRWYDRYQQVLEDYNRDGGDDNCVDTTSMLKNDPSLHRWWTTQKQRYNRFQRGQEDLPIERVQLLEALGVQSNRGALALRR